jgi:Carboxypeptidase regulatory-like domain
MRLYRIGLGGGLFVCAALAAGCGGPVHVEGKVVRDGKPLAGATVIFLPVGEGQEAGDVTDKEGGFRLKNPQKEGVLPGEYLVTVSKKVWPPGMKEPGPHELSIPLVAKMKESLPEKYTLKEKTPLKITVPRGGTKDLVLEIK